MGEEGGFIQPSCPTPKKKLHSRGQEKMTYKVRESVGQVRGEKGPGGRKKRRAATEMHTVSYKDHDNRASPHITA